jgi:hypothetical protein
MFTVMKYKGADGPREMAKIGRLTSNFQFLSIGISTLTDLKFKIVGSSSNEVK